MKWSILRIVSAIRDRSVFSRCYHLKKLDCSVFSFQLEADADRAIEIHPPTLEARNPSVRVTKADVLPQTFSDVCSLYRKLVTKRENILIPKMGGNFVNRVKRLMAVAVLAASTLGLTGAGAEAATASVANTLPNGFTAKIVAHSGEVITGTIDASGFDLGIYIGPGVHNVTITGATVQDANDQGILVQDASHVVIMDSTIKENARNINPDWKLSEVKAISLAGTQHVKVVKNTVEGNGDGGIGVYNDGPNSPFAPIAIDQTPVASQHNMVLDNTIKDNLNGCGIVVSAKNAGVGVVHNIIASNHVYGFDPAANDFNFGVGGIVVAGGEFGAVNVTDNQVAFNVVEGGFIPGISIHQSGSGHVTSTKLIGNHLDNNGKGEGIEIAGSGNISDTQILDDKVSNDTIGVFHVGDTNTKIANLQTDNVTNPVVTP